MKRRDMLKTTPLAAAAFSCSGANDNPVADTSALNSDGSIDTAGVKAEKPATIFQPDVTPDYSCDLVIVDYDGWVIELKQTIIKRYAISFFGYMRYIKRRKEVKGFASGVFNKNNKTITLNCVDSGWQEASIAYSFDPADANKMEGAYCYAASSRNNAIYGKILKSTIPGLVVAAPTSKIAVPAKEGPTVHPKLGIEVGVG